MTTHTRGTEPRFARIRMENAEIHPDSASRPLFAGLHAQERLIHELERADAAALAAFKPLFRMVEPNTGASQASMPHGCITDAGACGLLELVSTRVQAALDLAGARGRCGPTGDVNSAIARLVLSARRYVGELFKRGFVCFGVQGRVAV